jgi:hypothetical protein
MALAGFQANDGLRGLIEENPEAIAFSHDRADQRERGAVWFGGLGDRWLCRRNIRDSDDRRDRRTSRGGEYRPLAGDGQRS